MDYILNYKDNKKRLKIIPNHFFIELCSLIPIIEKNNPIEPIIPERNIKMSAMPSQTGGDGIINITVNTKGIKHNIAIEQ
ncbi:MAG: hypothetical protein B7Y83_11785 [Flavobacteriales bacterium 32-34-25]|nr:MAG: hypothetical protein B7Y83_11785 [Flavobacteriales bacterium 32-34-25]